MKKLDKQTNEIKNEGIPYGKTHLMLHMQGSLMSILWQKYDCQKITYDIDPCSHQACTR